MTLRPILLHKSQNEKSIGKRISELFALTSLFRSLFEFGMHLPHVRVRQSMHFMYAIEVGYEKKAWNLDT